MVVALLAGFVPSFGLIGGLEIMPGKINSMPYFGITDGWVRAHVGGLTNVLMVIAMALSLALISISQSKANKDRIRFDFCRLSKHHLVSVWKCGLKLGTFFRRQPFRDQRLVRHSWFLASFDRSNLSLSITSLRRHQVCQRQ